MPYLTQYGGLAQAAGVMELNNRTREADENHALNQAIHNFTSNFIRQVERGQEFDFRASESQKNRDAQVAEDQTQHQNRLGEISATFSGREAMEAAKREAKAAEQETVRGQLQEIAGQLPADSPLRAHPLFRAGVATGDKKLIQAGVVEQGKGDRQNAGIKSKADQQQVHFGQQNAAREDEQAFKAGEAGKVREGAMARLVKGGEQALARVAAGAKVAADKQAATAAEAVRKTAEVKAAKQQAEVERAMREEARANNFAEIDHALSDPKNDPASYAKGVDALVVAISRPRNPTDGTFRDTFDMLTIYDEYRNKLDKASASRIYTTATARKSVDDARYAPLMGAIDTGNPAAMQAVMSEMIGTGAYSEPQIARYLNSVDRKPEWDAMRLLTRGSPDYDSGYSTLLQFKNMQTGQVIRLTPKQARNQGYLGP